MAFARDCARGPKEGPRAPSRGRAEQIPSRKSFGDGDGDGDGGDGDGDGDALLPPAKPCKAC